MYIETADCGWLQIDKWARGLGLRDSKAYHFWVLLHRQTVALPDSSTALLLKASPKQSTENLAVA